MEGLGARCMVALDTKWIASACQSHKLLLPISKLTEYSALDICRRTLHPVLRPIRGLVCFQASCIAVTFQLFTIQFLAQLPSKCGISTLSTRMTLYFHTNGIQQFVKYLRHIFYITGNITDGYGGCSPHQLMSPHKH